MGRVDLGLMAMENVQFVYFVQIVHFC